MTPDIRIDARFGTRAEQSASRKECCRIDQNPGDERDQDTLKTEYGKRAIKAALVSSDAWAQLFMQLAYALLLYARGWMRQGGTYESAMTRRVFKGRTDVVRVIWSECTGCRKWGGCGSAYVR
jgi:hypothetical protein